MLEGTGYYERGNAPGAGMEMEPLLGTKCRRRECGAGGEAKGTAVVWPLPSSVRTGSRAAGDGPFGGTGMGDGGWVGRDDFPEGQMSGGRMATRRENGRGRPADDCGRAGGRTGCLEVAAGLGRGRRGIGWRGGKGWRTAEGEGGGGRRKGGRKRGKEPAVVGGA